MRADAKIPIAVDQRVEPHSARSLRCPFKTPSWATSDVEDALPGEELPRQAKLVGEELFKVAVSQRSSGVLAGLAPELELGIALPFELVKHMSADCSSYSLKPGHVERLSRRLAGVNLVWR